MWKESQYSLSTKLDGPQSLSGGFGQKKSLFPPGLGTPDPPDPVQSTSVPQVSI